MFGIAWIQRKLLFPSHLVRLRPFAPPPADSECHWLETDAGKVEFWFLAGDGVSASAPGPAVLFAHGNGERIDDWPSALAPYRRMGVSVVIVEYRGYGRSAGTPSEHAIVADFAAVYAHLANDARVDLARLVYHGRSLGGGVVCALARKHAPCALILESTFTSVVDVARGMGFPAFLIVDRFDSLPVVRAFAGPVLVFHGRQDTLIPVRHARELAAAHPGATLVLYDAGHNDLPPAGADYWSRIAVLLRSAQPLSSGAEACTSRGRGEM